MFKAKFNVTAVKLSIDGNGKPTAAQVEMAPVYGQDGTPNGEWSKYTPSGSVNLYMGQRNNVWVEG